MQLLSARQAWHDAFFLPWSQSMELIDLGCRVQKTQYDKSTGIAMHQALAGMIQRAIGTLPVALREFGHHLYSPLAGHEQRESAEESVYLLARAKSARMTAAKSEKARYVACAVLYRYRMKNQGGQGEGLDVLTTPADLREWLDARYGVRLSSEQWAREWEPFIALCTEICDTLDRVALSPVAGVLEVMKDAA